MSSVGGGFENNRVISVAREIMSGAGVGVIGLITCKYGISAIVSNSYGPYGPGQIVIGR